MEMGNRIFTSSKSYPVWLKAPFILLGLCLLVIVMSYGKFILMPLAFAGIIAMLLNPIVERFEKWKMGRMFSIILVLFLITLIFSGIFTLITVRVIELSDKMPEIAEKLKSTSVEGISTIERISGISQNSQIEYVKNAIENVFDTGGEFLSSVAGAATGTVSFLTFMPLFVFFMLYYKKMYVIFLQRIFENNQNSEIDKVLLRVQKVTQNYLVGVFTVVAIMAVLNSIGLLIIGLDYAIFFGIFASFLAFIPFVGAIIGALPAVLYAFLFYDTLWLPLMVIGIFTVVQLLESSYLTPRIVGSRVSINPFVAIIFLLLGGKIWGIAGMILFIPLIGIMRVGFSQVNELKPYGYLLGSINNYNRYVKGNEKDHK
jgi:predicted PurR-regulated permease PerM